MTDFDPAFIASETTRLRDQVILINGEMNNLIESVQFLSDKCEQEKDLETKQKLAEQLEESMQVQHGLKNASEKIMAKLNAFTELGGLVSEHLERGLAAEEDKEM